MSRFFSIFGWMLCFFEGVGTRGKIVPDKIVPADENGYEAHAISETCRFAGSKDLCPKHATRFVGHDTENHANTSN